MHRLALSLSASVVACAISQPVLATPLLTETFSYEDGFITTVSGGAWVAHSGASEPNSIVNEAFFINDDFTEDVNTGFASVTSGKLYAGLDLTVSSQDEPSATDAQTYFAHLGQRNASGSSISNFLGGIYLLQGSQAGKYQIGLNATPFGEPSVVAFANEFDSGVTYRVILEVDFDNDLAKVFVNPTSEADPSISDGFAGIGSANAFIFHNASTESGDKTIDNLVISTSFSEALVPEPASLGLLGLAAAGLMRRRRA